MPDELSIDNTIPGGRYIGVDGRPHDAHGRLLDADDDVARPADAQEPDEPPARTSKHAEKSAAKHGTRKHG